MSFPRSSYHWSPASPRLIFLESINQLKCCKPITYLNARLQGLEKGLASGKQEARLFKSRFLLRQPFHASIKTKADNIQRPAPNPVSTPVLDSVSRATCLSWETLYVLVGLTINRIVELELLFLEKNLRSREYRNQTRDKGCVGWEEAKRQSKSKQLISNRFNRNLLTSSLSKSSKRRLILIRLVWLPSFALCALLEFR